MCKDNDHSFKDKLQFDSQKRLFLRSAAATSLGTALSFSEFSRALAEGMVKIPPIPENVLTPNDALKRLMEGNERYVSNNLENLTPGRNLGNPYLDAESGWSEEVGVNYHITPSLVAKGTLFFRQSKELIDYVLTPASEIDDDIGELQPDGEYYFAQNISSVRTWGLELSATYSAQLSSNSHLDLSLGYSHIETTNKEGVVSVYLANHARDLITFSSVLDIDKFEVGLSALFKNRNERDATAINSSLEPQYFLLNGRVGYALTRQLSLSVKIQNIFDKDYQNILGSPMPGRWFMGSLSYSL